MGIRTNLEDKCRCILTSFQTVEEYFRFEHILLNAHIL